MKLTIQSTTKVVDLETPKGTVPARIWEGKSESGIPVICYVTRVQVHKAADNSEFERELEEHDAPSYDAQGIPGRLVL